MSDLVYAGIGSKSVDSGTFQVFKEMAEEAASAGYILRTGSALGVDTAFLIGCREMLGHEEVFKRKDCTHEALEYAQKLLGEECWEVCDEFTRNVHGRNCMIILGKDLQTPVKFVLCWTPNAELTEGTRTAVLTAQAEKIPVYNFADLEVARLQRDIFKR